MAHLDLGLTGPAQSNDLFHFTGRAGGRPEWVPEGIRAMDARQRLSAILSEKKILAFPPFGATTPCVCFSECPPKHLAYLIGQQRFQPWGVIAWRSDLLDSGGGTVAYVPNTVYDEFKTAGLEHWAVRTDNGSAWLHEREWRLPRSAGVDHVKLLGLRAILIGDADWRPDPVVEYWVDGSTGGPIPGPDGNPETQPITDLPELWRKSAIWVWDRKRESVVTYEPGELC